MLVKIKIQFSGNDICSISNYIEVDEFKFNKYFKEFVPYSWEQIVDIHPGLSERLYANNSDVRWNYSKISVVEFETLFGEEFEL